MSDPLPSCPRCGGALTRRLSELDCAACGYFVHQDFAEQPAAAQRVSGSAVTWHTDVNPRPLSTAAGINADSFQRREGLLARKRVFLWAFGISFLFSGAGALALQGGEFFRRYLLDLLLGTGGLTLVLMGVLLSDWLALKYCALVAAILLCIGNFVTTAGVWNAKAHVASAFPLFQALMCIWLALLLAADIREQRSRA